MFLLRVLNRLLGWAKGMCNCGASYIRRKAAKKVGGGARASSPISPEETPLSVSHVVEKKAPRVRRGYRLKKFPA